VFKKRSDKKPDKNIREQSISFISDNLKIRGKVLFPYSASTESPVPGVVLCHGFGSSHKQMETSARLLAGRGIATIIFDFRGHCSSEGSLDAGMVNDIFNAWNILRDYPEVDKSRMGLAGHSLGAMSSIIAAEYLKPDVLVALSCPPMIEDMFPVSPEEFGRWGADHNRVMEYPRQGAFPWMKGMSALVCRAWMYIFGYTVRVNMKKFAETAFKWNMKDSLNKLQNCAKLFVFCEGDTVTPYTKSVAVYNAAPEPKTHILIRGGMHTTPIMRGDLRSQWVNWISDELTR